MGRACQNKKSPSKRFLYPRLACFCPIFLLEERIMRKTILILAYVFWGIGWFAGGYLFADFVNYRDTYKKHNPPAVSIAGSGDDGFHMVYENGEKK